MPIPASWSVDFETYLRFEREAEDRHELIDGEIVAMAGASRRHNLLCGRLVEVTSKSTEHKDRGVKLEDYRQIAALDEYLIVSHVRRELELWTRGTAGWTRRLVTEGALTLASGAVLDVACLYDGLPD